MRELGATWSAPTGTAGLEWTPDDLTLLYAKYSRGYKSGGYNAGYLLPTPETGPETLDAFEVGGKRQWFNHTLTTDVALFYYNYYGMQIPLSVQPTTGPAQTNTFNMKEVVSYGAELETIWTPIEHLQFLFDYSYLNATIHDNDCFLDSGDPDAQAPGASGKGCPAPTSATGIFPNQFQRVNGATIPEAPHNKIALNGTYTFVFEPGSLSLSASYIWKDKTYDSIFNRAYNLAPAYDQVDLTATWTDSKNRYTIIAFGKNVFNTLGYDGVAGVRLNNEPFALYKNFGLIPPATYGVQLQVRFR
jgi:iron complex outermembrane receptor protein